MEDGDETMEVFFLHPATIRLRKTWEHRKKGALQDLLNACNDSSDPLVRGAFNRWQVLDEGVLELGGGR